MAKIFLENLCGLNLLQILIILFCIYMAYTYLSNRWCRFWYANIIRYWVIYRMANWIGQIILQTNIFLNTNLAPKRTWNHSFITGLFLEAWKFKPETICLVTRNTLSFFFQHCAQNVLHACSHLTIKMRESRNINNLNTVNGS